MEPTSQAAHDWSGVTLQSVVLTQISSALALTCPILRQRPKWKYSLVQVAAGDESPPRDLYVVHIADKRSRGLGEVVKGVCRRKLLDVSVDSSHVSQVVAQSYLQQTSDSTVNVPHVPAPAVGWA